MRNMSLLGVIILLLSFNVKAQNTICSTSGELPSGQETYVRTNTSPGGGCNYFVRVFFHIIRRGDNTGGQQSSIINTIMNTINSSYSGQNISFQNSGSDEIYNDSYYNIANGDDNTYRNLISTNFQSNCINIYLLDNNSSFNGGLAGGIGSRALLVGGGYTPPGDVRQTIIPSTVISHEIGHCLGLYHTFSTLYCAERSDGSNCDRCGDFVCDTPAENQNYTFQENANCQYTVNFTDPVGAQQNPIVTNIMNYARPSCLQSFTNGQGNRMRSVIAMSSEVGPAVAVTPVYVGGIYDYGTNTFPIQNSSTGISVSSSANNISIVLPNYGTSTNYSWVVNSRSGYTNYSFGGRVANIVPNGGASINVTCNISNACGSTSVTFNCYNYSSGFRMAAYPNPASQEMTIAAVKDDESDNEFKDDNMASDQPVQEKELVDIDAFVKLLDIKNNILKEGTIKKGKIVFDTNKLPSGTYYLQMDYKDKKIKKQIIVQH